MEDILEIDTISSGCAFGRWLKIVGRPRAMDASVKQVMLAEAPVELNLLSFVRRPAAKNAMPKTKSKLDKMEPNKLPCTTLTKPALIALIVTIISTALPKVAFSKPPIICPVCAARHSVEAPRIPANGTIAVKLQAKVHAQPHSRFGLRMPSGTKTKRMFSHWHMMLMMPRHSRPQLKGSASRTPGCCVLAIGITCMCTCGWPGYSGGAPVSPKP
mmetsp:Transcript_54562/g.137765  ORF Transcript_54562/g.137765 Transcript_54562/m.137765 type:complete len:215 (-) Transcript_54562:262-906(-)